MKQYNVLESIWFGKVGIVRVQTEYAGVKYYIGVGEGLSQEADEQQIAAWGRKAAPEVIKQFFQE